MYFVDIESKTMILLLPFRLGWIPLEAGHAIEDLDDYAPEPEVHAFLRSRLLNFPTDTLYELHYQMITLGKVFCSKSDPNCKACPMQSHCEYAENDGPSLHGRKRLKVWQYEDDIRVTTPQKTEKIKYSTDDRGQISYGAGGTGSAIVNIKHDWDKEDLPLEHLIGLRSTRVRNHRSVSRLDYVSNTMIEEMKTELCYLASQSLHCRMVPWIPVQLLRDCHSEEIRSIWDTLDEDELSMDLLTRFPTVPTEFNSTSSTMSIWDMEDIGNCSAQVMQAAKTYKYRQYACRANNFENAVAFSNLNKKNIDEVDLRREDVPKDDHVDMVDAHQKGAKAALSPSDPVSEEKMDNVTDLDSLIENLNQFEAEMEAVESSPTAETVENGQDTSSNSPNPNK